MTSQTILLLEEDKEVRLLRDILRPRGYDVVPTAGIGRPALDRIAADRPGAKVLAVSGYGAHPEMRADALGARTAFLPKPFTVMSLLAKVRGLLDQPGDPYHDF